MSNLYLLRSATNTIFIVNILLDILWAWIFLYMNNNSRTEERKRKNKKIFCILASLQWILISGLRAEWVGNDTINYLGNFKAHCDMEWSKVFGNFLKYYAPGGDPSQHFEPGYVLFERIVGIFTQSGIGLNFAVAIVFMSAFGRFIYKNSTDPFVSYMIYSGFLYFMFSLTGYRQVLSVAVSILIGYEYIKERKFFKFMICILIGAMLHKSALIFTVFYFLANKKITKSYIAVVCIASIGFLVFRGPMFNLVTALVGYDYEAISSGTPTTFAALLAIIMVVSIVLYKKVFEIDTTGYAQHYYNGLFIAAMGLFAAFVNPTALRVVYNFMFLMLLLVPRLLDTFVGAKNRLIAYGVLVAIFIYYIFTTTTPYHFFWEYRGYYI